MYTLNTICTHNFVLPVVRLIPTDLTVSANSHFLENTVEFVSGFAML
jgi:hypothetical protein